MTRAMAVSAVVQGLILWRVLTAEAAHHGLRFQFSGIGRETRVMFR
jgi:hypothetical protein